MPLKCRELTVIKEFRELNAQILFYTSDLTVHGECLNVQVSVVKDGASRGLVNTLTKQIQEHAKVFNVHEFITIKILYTLTNSAG